MKDVGIKIQTYFAHGELSFPASMAITVVSVCIQVQIIDCPTEVRGDAQGIGTGKSQTDLKVLRTVWVHTTSEDSGPLLCWPEHI